MKKGFLFIFLLLFFETRLIAAPISDRQQAIKDAAKDVRSAATQHFFSGAGTGFGLSVAGYLGLFASNRTSTANCPLSPPVTIDLLGLSTVSTFYLLKVDVPAVKLLGQSPAYVDVYMKTYQNGVRMTRAGGAAFGCGTGCVLALLVSHLFFNDAEEHYGSPTVY